MLTGAGDNVSELELDTTGLAGDIVLSAAWDVERTWTSSSEVVDDGCGMACLESCRRPDRSRASVSSMTMTPLSLSTSSLMDKEEVSLGTSMTESRRDGSGGTGVLRSLEWGPGSGTP